MKGRGLEENHKIKREDYAQSIKFALQFNGYALRRQCL